MPATARRPAISYRPGEAGRGFKPHPWAIQRRLVAPEWRWAWSGQAALLLPLWWPTPLLDYRDGVAGAKQGAGAVTESHVFWGQALNFPGDARYLFAGRGDLGDTDVTCAFVYRPAEVTEFSEIIVTSHGVNAGFRFSKSNDPFWTFTKGGVADVTSNIAPTENVPYFVGISYRASDGRVFFYERDLRSGAVRTDTVTNTQAPSAGDGDWALGGTSTVTSANAHGDLGAAYFFRASMGRAELDRLARDPFGPFCMWHPAWGTSFQILRPASDVETGGWQNELGGTTGLWQSIDEETPDAADFVESPA